MEVNKPDRGVFNGLGRLQPTNLQQRKVFPQVRNRGELSFSHNQRRDFQTSTDHFAIK